MGSVFELKMEGYMYIYRPREVCPSAMRDKGWASFEGGRP